MIPYLTFVLFKVPLGLTILQILVVDLGTDLLPALGLGVERSDPDAMKRPPRLRHERLLDWPLVFRSYGFLGIWEALGAIAVFFYVLGQNGWHYGERLAWDDPVYRQATAACLSCIVLLQVVNAHLCRSEQHSIFSLAWFDNRLLWLAILIELILILVIDYTPWGNWLFGTAPIGADAWLFMIPFALLMLAAEETRKLLVKKWLERRQIIVK